MNKEEYRRRAKIAAHKERLEMLAIMGKTQEAIDRIVSQVNNDNAKPSGWRKVLTRLGMLP